MNLLLLGVLLAIIAVAYQIGLSRSQKLAGQGKNTAMLNSRPGYYGAMVALWCGIPAFLIFMIWNLVEPVLLEQLVLKHLPQQMVAGMDSAALSVIVDRVQALASGFGVSDTPQAYELAAAEQVARIMSISSYAKLVVVISVAVAGLVWAKKRISNQLRARYQVEKVINISLALCSGVAILTTLGIVMSMFGEAMRFFSFVSPIDFFFGTQWNPGFSTSGNAEGSYGLLPLLWGTLMVSGIALLVAVPLGLMIAIYLSEYASPKFRSWAKPTIEVLAGIPTIVYGVFALMILGPFIKTLGAMVGVDINATSALTAGFVMGIMIIPFVSSLSDDIITQVPRALRDGSLGLGATKSETIRQVVLPAALPGIIGAFLLAASRAIGETMIVVLAAGNSPLLHANPLEAVSTVTITIVNQLTGDTDFASPQALVAFALGLTLFVITLGLNIVALYIVRKYREQYD
ncbi:phosphate ABC transporter permease subunit PstC [Acinetobacter schindleri]|jgi:phosphate transport system permease protein|uniref:Phosphate transport system permease protein n=2 Tax=Acinetobacter schindleri TaxID=108981 RepID=N8Z5Q6_9GAMM|nr:phosphate ABC transporter permease subunit PstC [Acinetobacter schindleri]ENV44281.1 phosphate ABC transporter, permease PstC [Acinetobacter schindleri CIP 107287]MCK8639551.1 phosphate ABC transporter permease subunit PstC [Acinetobacter schindleri]MCU4323298.1 phosphate ABC transporter permease subunit PstC [Acinetobacter schindleri]MEB5929506.1 phosphate ABC transporter permease subunit PstC [Acinetobacter schindleri]QIC60243.1 phosphate ABC transporter permease subunit PstC [Acinetobact